MRFPNLNDPLMKAIKAVNSISGNSLTEEDLKRQRAAMDRAGALAASTIDAQVESFSVGRIKCEKVTPDYAFNPRFVILYAHGGGYVCGGLGYARILAAKMAIATGFEVVSFAYRLAPEHPYPAPLEDALAVWGYLRNEGYGADHILLAGDSAGGNLSLCLTQKLIADGGEIPAELLLFSPWTDMTATSPSYKENEKNDPVLTMKYITGVRDVFIPEDADPEDPIYSPLFGDFKDFPPVLVQVGQNEVLLDDSRSLAYRIENSGGSVTLDVEKEGWHVYQQMPIALATRAMKRLSAFVTRTIY